MIREQRQVGLRTILDLLKQNPKILIFAIVLTSIPVIFGGLFLFVFSLAASDSPQADVALVDKNGTVTQAIITHIEIQSNISINNEHPRIISYTYNNGEKFAEDKFNVLDSLKTWRLVIGDTIQIKHYNGQSIISGLKAYAFPTDILLLILTPFLIMGLIVWGLLYWRVKAKVDLYKMGRMTTAEIISMTPVSGLPISGIGQRVIVHYQYLTTGGQKLLGESTTTDYTFFTSKTQGDIIKIVVATDNETKSTVVSRLDEIRNNWK